MPENNVKLNECQIRPAMRCLHGKPAHEFYIVEVNYERQSVLLIRTDSRIYNNGSHYQQHEDGQDKPFYPYWAPIREVYVSGNTLSNKPPSED